MEALTFDFSLAAILTAFGIFFLRVSDMALDTIRVLFMMRGRKGPAWVLGFFQALIFVVAISSVLANLDNPLNILGYAAGYASGVVVGILIEDRLAIGHTQLTVVSSKRGAIITDMLRDNGFAVTEVSARGKDGMVSQLHVAVRRKQVDQAETIILEADPTAFITSEEVRPMRRGYWRA